MYLHISPLISYHAEVFMFLVHKGRIVAPIETLQIWLLSLGHVREFDH